MSKAKIPYEALNKARALVRCREVEKALVRAERRLARLRVEQADWHVANVSGVLRIKALEEESAELKAAHAKQLATATAENAKLAKEVAKLTEQLWAATNTETPRESILLQVLDFLTRAK